MLDQGGNPGMNEHVIRVWDLPTRVAHWAGVALFAAAIVSVKIGGNAMVWHGRVGLALLGLVVFRIVWGLVGSTYARFAAFVPRPRALADYLAGRWRGAGHNPLGALSVLALLAFVAFQSSAGLFANDDIAFYGPLAELVSDEFGALASGLHRQADDHRNEARERPGDRKRARRRCHGLRRGARACDRGGVGRRGRHPAAGRTPAAGAELVRAARGAARRARLSVPQRSVETFRLGSRLWSVGRGGNARFR